MAKAVTLYICECLQTGRKVCVQKRHSIVWVDPEFCNKMESSDDKRGERKRPGDNHQNVGSQNYRTAYGVSVTNSILGRK